MRTSRVDGFRHTVRIEDALDKTLKELGDIRPSLESILTDDSLGRILGEDIVSPLEIPSYNKSAVDGYAVIAEDTFGSTQTNPAELRIVGDMPAGSESSFHIGRRETVQIATGAHVPEGADAVVMVEHTKKIDSETIHVYSPVAPFENVIRIGDDVRKGSIALRRGIRIEPQDLGMLVALGVKHLYVTRKPRIGVLSTGEELVSTLGEAGLGKTVDVNRPILMNLVKAQGGVPMDLGIARDDVEDISSRIREGIENCDMVLVSAGTSVGKADLVPEVINSIGKPGMLVHGVSMKPGMPTGLAIVQGRPIVSLPGHPVAAIIGFRVFALPLIRRMLGSTQDFGTMVKARLTRRIQSSFGMRTFVRVLVKKSSDGYVAEPVRTSGSSILSSMTKSNGVLAIADEREGIEAGEMVDVELFRPIEKENNDE
jgi:molybdenum cofactor synthesis domain-containing protein